MFYTCKYTVLVPNSDCVRTGHLLGQCVSLLLCMLCICTYVCKFVRTYAHTCSTLYFVADMTSNDFLHSMLYVLYFDPPAYVRIVRYVVSRLPKYTRSMRALHCFRDLRMYVRMYVCTYVYMYVCIRYVCMYVCMYVCIRYVNARIPCTTGDHRLLNSCSFHLPSVTDTSLTVV